MIIFSRDMVRCPRDRRMMLVDSRGEVFTGRLTHKTISNGPFAGEWMATDGGLTVGRVAVGWAELPTATFDEHRPTESCPGSPNGFHAVRPGSDECIYCGEILCL